MNWARGFRRIGLVLAAPFAIPIVWNSFYWSISSVELIFLSAAAGGAIYALFSGLGWAIEGFK